MHCFQLIFNLLFPPVNLPSDLVKVYFAFVQVGSKPIFKRLLLNSRIESTGLVKNLGQVKLFVTHLHYIKIDK